MSWISRGDRIRTAKNILENLKYQDITIKEPNSLQERRGYIGSEEWIKEVYAFHCKPGSERTFYFPGNERFKQWITTDEAKETILHFGPYYDICKWNGKIYQARCPELQEFYIKFKKEKDEIYKELRILEKKEIHKELSILEKDSELHKMILWYNDKKECPITPKIAKDSVKIKIDIFISLKQKYDSL